LKKKKRTRRRKRSNEKKLMSRDSSKTKGKRLSLSSRRGYLLTPLVLKREQRSRKIQASASLVKAHQCSPEVSQRQRLKNQQ